MSQYNWPAGDSRFGAARFDLTQAHNNRTFTSVLSQSTQTLSLPGARWGWVVTFPEQSNAFRQAIEAWLTRLSGMEHRAVMFDVARPSPLGSIALSGVTAASAAQFASSITLNNCGAGATLKSGDWFSVATAAGTQLLMTSADALADGTGAMTVEFRHSLRAAVTAGAAVVTQQPTALYLLKQPGFVTPRGPAAWCPSFTVEFVETFA